MTLPNFLVIGAQRSGTSWLDQKLRNHIDIYLPSQRKEVHYFDRYYNRGVPWYERFFPSESEAKNYQRMGEITPGYMYKPEVPRLISELIPKCKFIAILRNPADRAYSNYGHKVRNEAYRKSFQRFLEEYPGTFEKGLYAEQIARYFQYFSPENFLFLTFEETMDNQKQALEKIFDFLSLDSSRYLGGSSQKRVNASYVVKHAKAYTMTRNFISWLMKNDLDWIYNAAKDVGLGKSIFGSKGELSEMNSADRQKLLAAYEEDIRLLESMLQRDFSFWRV